MATVQLLNRASPENAAVRRAALTAAVAGKPPKAPRAPLPQPGALHAADEAPQWRRSRCAAHASDGNSSWDWVGGGGGSQGPPALQPGGGSGWGRPIRRSISNNDTVRASSCESLMFSTTHAK